MGRSRGSRPAGERPPEHMSKGRHKAPSWTLSQTHSWPPSWTPSWTQLWSQPGGGGDGSRPSSKLPMVVELAAWAPLSARLGAKLCAQLGAEVGTEVGAELQLPASAPLPCFSQHSKRTWWALVGDEPAKCQSSWWPRWERRARRGAREQAASATCASATKIQTTFPTSGADTRRCAQAPHGRCQGSAQRGGSCTACPPPARPPASRWGSTEEQGQEPASRRSTKLVQQDSRHVPFHAVEAVRQGHQLGDPRP